MNMYSKLSLGAIFFGVLLNASWARIAERPEDNNQTYQQSVANEVDRRLALLQENRAKHAQIAQQVKSGDIPQQSNFENVSAEKQAILDQPGKNYYKQSWAPDHISDQEKEILYNQNKSLIKENFRLGGKLTDAKTTQNTIGQATRIRISPSVIGNLGLPGELMALGSDKNSQTLVDDGVYYKNVKDSKTGEYKIVRSGISNEDSFVPEVGNETVQQYADRYTKANMTIKPQDPISLKQRLQKENAQLANTVIPEAQNYLNWNNVKLAYKSGAENSRAGIDFAANVNSAISKIADFVQN